jgi:hypothetical protein
VYRSYTDRAAGVACARASTGVPQARPAKATTINSRIRFVIIEIIINGASPPQDQSRLE